MGFGKLSAALDQPRAYGQHVAELVLDEVWKVHREVERPDERGEQLAALSERAKAMLELAAVVRGRESGNNGQIWKDEAVEAFVETVRNAYDLVVLSTHRGTFAPPRKRSAA